MTICSSSRFLRILDLVRRDEGIKRLWFDLKSVPQAFLSEKLNPPSAGAMG